MAAALKVAGSSGVYYVVPCLGALAVWLTYKFGKALESRLVGMASAVLLSASPIFLLHIIVPMTDVPATAWWLAAVVLATRRTKVAALMSGLMASVATMTRPNLAPLGVLVAVLHFIGTSLGDNPPVRGRMVNALLFATGFAPGCLADVWINSSLYGSMVLSGHGRVADFFAWAHVPSNWRRYSQWLIRSQTWFIAAGLVMPLLASIPVVRRDFEWDGSIRLVWFSVVFAAAVLGLYLPYLVFRDWLFLRFLLPGLPFLIVLSCAASIAVIRQVPAVARAPTLILLCGVLTVWYVREARARQAFTLWSVEQRYAEAGRYVAEHLPTRAVILAMQESGSVRYYSERMTLRWDLLDRAWLDRTIAFLRERGHAPYILLEPFEVPLFQERFWQQTYGALDWPPMAEITGPSPVWIWNPTDRAASGDTAANKEAPVMRR